MFPSSVKQDICVIVADIPDPLLHHQFIIKLIPFPFLIMSATSSIMSMT